MGRSQQPLSQATSVFLMVMGAALFLAAADNRESLARPHIAYRIFRSTNAPKDVPALQMELTIENLGKDRQLDLRVPAVFGPAGSQFPKAQLFTNFEIDSEVSGGQWVESSDTRWRVQFGTADQPVVVRYTLKQPYSGPPFDRKLVFAPAI
jgi:hypothetical protein